MHGKLLWPVFSPDGNRLAVIGDLLDFTSEPTVPETHTLYAYDLPTARFADLTSGSITTVFSPTGAVSSRGGATGELMVDGTVAWTPDGRALLYLIFDGGSGNASTWTLRSVDATGGSPSSVVIDDVQSFDVGPRH